MEILTLNYKTFKMKLKESIKIMVDRFTIIINGLKLYRKTEPNKEVLVGSFLTHERMLSERVEEAKHEKKKVGVTINSTIIKDSESSEEVDKDKEMVMFTRIFK
ncbi:hypothetical protein J1N35_035184, partial [Gossypium stocksii]